MLALAGCSTGCSTGYSTGLPDGPSPEDQRADQTGGVDGGRDQLPPITTILCNGDCRDLVVSRLVLPTAATSATLGLDLDGDGKVDNALGSILGTLATVSPSTNTQHQLDESVFGGSVLLLLRIQASDFVNTSQAVAQVWRGAGESCCTNPDDLPQCKAQALADCFGGSHTFQLHLTSPSSAILGGTISAGAVRLGPSALTLTLQLSGASTLDLALRSVYVMGQLGSSGVSHGVIAGVVPRTEIDGKLIPMMATMLNDTLTDPTASQSTRDTIRNLFDANHDGLVDLTEVQSNGLVKTLLAGDVDVDHDGSAELSLGLGFEAVAAIIGS